MTDADAGRPSEAATMPAATPAATPGTTPRPHTPRPGDAAPLGLTIVIEYRFSRTPDGRIWTSSMYPHAYWDRYLGVFRDVRIVARARDVPTVPPEWSRVDGPRVSVCPMPWYHGPTTFLPRLPRVWKAMRDALAPVVREPGAVILRVPGTLGTIAARQLERMRRPFGLEVVGDPALVFSSTGSTHPLRALWRSIFVRQLRRQTASASSVLYVTERALQHAYPASGYTVAASSVQLEPDAFGELPPPPRPLPVSKEFAASDADLGDAAFSPDDRELRHPGETEPIRLVFVGALDQRYKGLHILLEALARNAYGGRPVALRIVGDGKERPAYEALARRLRLTDRVEFLGELSAGLPVQEQLDHADLFVMPSLVEGLPRALVEAMARGLPAVASAVGGIPELLAEDALVPPGDVDALAAALARFVAEPTLRARHGRRNFRRANDFRRDVLQERREGFYRHVAESARRVAESAG